MGVEQASGSRFRKSARNGMRRLMHLRFRLTRAMTLGVRAAVFDAQDRIFLVRHTYVPGWHLPGGGVEPGQTLIKALEDELRQEAAIELSGKPHLHGVFFNNRYSNRDHVAVFVVSEFTILSERKPDWEIAECGFFDLDALPDATTQATQARLDEIRGLRARSDMW